MLKLIINIFNKTKETKDYYQKYSHERHDYRNTQIFDKYIYENLDKSYLYSMLSEALLLMTKFFLCSLLTSFDAII
ncbi:hypothetical protein BpHYR1_032428 [Brachionus plicatilis]|uniref:Uncharacterized protein n=1 Tax=Brachionus plicatilis TaxID=10195 RepID=A0A3M7T2R7_BRAPC|nr:hypothetical protein BpHYR1_032428 [Brachionus plicatilis]